jgi:hypothetical protein
MIYQHPLPFCIRCGAMHMRFLEKTYSQYCQRCEDQTVVEAYFNRRRSIAKTDEEVLEVVRAKRPDLFSRGVLPDYWRELKGKDNGGSRLRESSKARLNR